jgi:hypothetical protein
MPVVLKRIVLVFIDFGCMDAPNSVRAIGSIYLLVAVSFAKCKHSYR